MTKGVIFDLDGTLADLSHRVHHVRNGSRNWDAFFAECGDDAVIEPVRELAQALHRAGYRIILASGRTDKVRRPDLRLVESQRYTLQFALHAA